MDECIFFVGSDGFRLRKTRGVNAKSKKQFQSKPVAFRPSATVVAVFSKGSFSRGDNFPNQC